MDFKAYGQAVVLGARSMLSAAAGWRSNPLTGTVNRRMWGRPWVVALATGAVAAVFVELLLPPLARLAGLAPPLIVLTFVPDLVLDLLYSGPAWFAIVVAWRMRKLRGSGSSSWPERASTPEFGGALFDAAALPIAVAAVAIGIGIQFAPAVVAIGNAGAGGGTMEAAPVFAAAGSGRFARTVLVVALVAGIGSVHRTFSAAFGKLMGAGFVVWGVHIGIGFAVPWMTAWWSYLPWIGRFAPERSASLAHALFDLAVGCAAWIAVREKWFEAPLWEDSDARSEPVPLPPPPPPAGGE